MLEKVIYCYLTILMATMLVVLSGCADNDSISSEPKQVNPKQSELELDASPEVDRVGGTVEIFEYDGLNLEVSNVKEIKLGQSYDGVEVWEYVIYIVYPGAIIKVLDADTFVDEESGCKHADWALLTANNSRIDIEDGMADIEVTEDILGVYDPESSVYVLGFEVCSSSENN